MLAWKCADPTVSGTRQSACCACLSVKEAHTPAATHCGTHLSPHTRPNQQGLVCLQASRPLWEQAGSYDMACPVDSLLFESGFLFVGMHAPGQGAPLTWPGCIKVWNTTTNAHHQLEGFQASPRCMGLQACRQPVGRAMSCWRARGI